MKTPPPRNVGSIPITRSPAHVATTPDKLDKFTFQSTTSPATLGSHALPFSRHEFVKELTAGNPCEIPRSALFDWLHYLESLCDYCQVNCATDRTVAQVRPVQIRLSRPKVEATLPKLSTLPRAYLLTALHTCEANAKYGAI